jgi:hypothetical protein
VHCSRVFRSSAPSDLLPSSPGGRPSRAGPGECGSTRSKEWGVGPGGGVSYRGSVRQRYRRRAHPGRHVPGPVRSQGVARCVIQNWPYVLSAPHATAVGATPAGPVSGGASSVGPDQARLGRGYGRRTSRLDLGGRFEVRQDAVRKVIARLEMGVAPQGARGHI